MTMITENMNDGATGLYYYRARYYSPELGRFISEDPIGLLGGVNYFAYVGNSPCNFRDPLGLEPYGKDDCSYYDKKCDEVGGLYYCIFAPMVCKDFPDLDSNWDECVRQCLQEFDEKICQDSCGEPKFDYTCIADAHAYCFLSCFENSNDTPVWIENSPTWSPEWPPTPLDSK